MITQAELQAVARVFCLSICKNKAGKDVTQGRIILHGCEVKLGNEASQNV